MARKKRIGRPFHGFIVEGLPKPPKTERGRNRMWLFVTPPSGWRTICVLSYGKIIHIRYEKVKLAKA
jgi:hypothetical protein